MKTALALAIAAFVAGVAGISVRSGEYPYPTAIWFMVLVIGVSPVLLMASIAAYASHVRPRFRALHWAVAALSSVTFGSLTLGFISGRMRMSPTSEEMEAPLWDVSGSVWTLTLPALPVAAALATIAILRWTDTSWVVTVLAAATSAIIGPIIAGLAAVFVMIMGPTAMIYLSAAALKRASTTRAPREASS